LVWYDEPKLLETVTKIINYIFSAIFLIEAIIKIIGLGKRYFKNKWNIFDLLISIGAIVGIILDKVANISGVSSTTALRSFRVMRILKLFRR
jgi:hypothetical protein